MVEKSRCLQLLKKAGSLPLSQNELREIQQLLKEAMSGDDLAYEKAEKIIVKN